MRARLLSCALLFGTLAASAQTAAPPVRYQTVLDRLQAMSTVALPDWRYHDADIPHPEDPSLDDASWALVNLTAPNAAGWYRRWIEIPAAAGGKDIHGARVDLA